MFKTKLFGFDKDQVSEFVNASVDYVVKLKKDIEFLKNECNEFRKYIDNYEKNNSRYFHIIEDAYMQADLIVKKAELQAEKIIKENQIEKL